MLNDHVSAIIDYAFMAIGVALFIGALFLGGFETINEIDYINELLNKVADGTIEPDEREYLLRKLK